MGKKHKIFAEIALIVWSIIVVALIYTHYPYYPLAHLFGSVVGYRFLKKADRIKNNPFPALGERKREKKGIRICALLGILAIPVAWLLYKSILKEEGITDQEFREYEKQRKNEKKRQCVARMIF